MEIFFSELYYVGCCLKGKMLNVLGFRLVCGWVFLSIEINIGIGVNILENNRMVYKLELEFLEVFF